LETNTDQIPQFIQTLAARKLGLKRYKTRICQLNLGLICNQACKHCHLSAGPGRTELMDRETMAAVLDRIGKSEIEIVDITGGAPELNPHLPWLMDQVAGLGKQMMLRCNLSALYELKTDEVKERLETHKTTVVASFPSLNLSQTDAQRGGGTHDLSIKALKMLNDMGYGQEGSGLALDLVSNPSGAFMPAAQDAAEKRFGKVLYERFGIVFNHLFTFANMPLGRFEIWLRKTGNYHSYLSTLHKGFNPCTVEGLMCRNLISVSWDGYLYDCDFNLAAGLAMGNTPLHISEVRDFSFEGRDIAAADHCYACTAGAGFT